MRQFLATGKALEDALMKDTRSGRTSHQKKEILAAKNSTGEATIAPIGGSGI
jgi:hypothetical protein